MSAAAIECPYCGSEHVRETAVEELYRCRDCGEYFEDAVPSIEETEHTARTTRTKLQREE